jgi:hypothetical protein
LLIAVNEEENCSGGEEVKTSFAGIVFLGMHKLGIKPSQDWLRENGGIRQN